MRTYVQLLLGLVGFPLVCGCAVTIKEFRESPLMILANVSGRHESTANCVMLRLEETADAWPDTFRVTTEGSHTSLLISHSPSGPFTPTPSPLAEIVFTETRPKELLIESRSMPSANAAYYLEQTKPLIAKCGKQSTNNSSSASLRHN